MYCLLLRTRVVALGVSNKSESLLLSWRRRHSSVVAALRGNAFSAFLNTSAARACCSANWASVTSQQKLLLMTPLLKYS